MSATSPRPMTPLRSTPRARDRRRLAALVVALVGCAPESLYTDRLATLGPVATDEALVWIDLGRHEAVFVRPRGDDLDIRRVGVGDEHSTVAWSAATRDRRALLALTVPASAKEEDVDEQLYRLPGDGEGEPVIYDVRAPFTALALSPDLRRAVLYFGAGAVGEQLHNANQIAFVDLTGDRAENVTLNGFGGALLSVEFPGQQLEGQPSPVIVGGVQRDIAAFLATSEVVLIDMDDPALDQVAVPLGEDVGFNPATTLLRAGDPLYADPALFVRPAAGGEVGMLTLLAEGDGSGFTAQIGLIPVGQTASDFVHYNSATVPYLITVDSGADALIFTDIRTQGGFTVPLEADAQRIFLREVVGGQQAVAWAKGGDMISTLDLTAIEDSLARKPRTLKIEGGIDELVRLDNDRVLIGAGARLYVVDLRSEQVTPLSSQSPYDPEGSALLGDQLLLGTVGQSWVSTVDLLTLSPESMLLDDVIAGFYYLAGPKEIVVTHASEIGFLTLVDPAEPRRSTSRIHWGFLLEGALDRE